jgi:hypothetical protein
MKDNMIRVLSLMEDNSIAEGETEYSPILIEVYALQPNGNFSMQLEVDATSVGSATVFYECTNVKASPDVDRFIKPASGSDIFTAFAKDAGAAGDGRDLKDFNVETCWQIRIGVTAVGGAVKIKKLICAVQ